MFNMIPCCYFPTEVVLVDDNAIFLNRLQLDLGDNSKVTAFTNPKEALEYLRKKSHLSNDFVNKYLEHSINNNGEVTRKGTLVKIGQLHQEIYNPKRFEIISVVVVDYAMPQMNGQQFCNALEGVYYKVLMLTGEADNKIAVDLFNQGIIHKFLLKAQKNYVEEVVRDIEELRRQYFISLSQVFTDLLGTDLTAILSDPAYIEKYNHLCKENNIVESYLLDDSGSQLLLDASGKQMRWFIVKTNEDLQTFYEIASDEEQDNSSVSSALYNREKITHFFTIQDSMEPPKKWRLYKADKINGKNTYYYSVVKGAENMPIEVEKILPYETFLRESDSE